MIGGGEGNKEGGGATGLMSLLTVIFAVLMSHKISHIGIDSKMGLVTPAIKSGLVKLLGSFLSWRIETKNEQTYTVCNASS